MSNFCVFYFDLKGFSYLLGSLSEDYHQILKVESLHQSDNFSVESVNEVLNQLQSYHLYSNDIAGVKQCFKSIKCLNPFNEADSVASLNILVKSGQLSLTEHVKSVLETWELGEVTPLIAKPLLLFTENFNNICSTVQYHYMLKHQLFTPRNRRFRY
ncbi:MAG: hypothetical protein KME22_10265 [Hassallia sp. WJT32-NPBG1]|jgi:hypothetical protein|nr:hypothetical protein [Hassallia sp. WJT32-NPBG1]